MWRTFWIMPRMAGWSMTSTSWPMRRRPSPRTTFAGLRDLKEPAHVARLRGKELEELVGAGDRAQA